MFTALLVVWLHTPGMSGDRLSFNVHGFSCICRYDLLFLSNTLKGEYTSKVLTVVFFFFHNHACIDIPLAVEFLWYAWYILFGVRRYGNVLYIHTQIPVVDMANVAIIGVATCCLTAPGGFLNAFLSLYRTMFQWNSTVVQPLSHQYITYKCLCCFHNNVFIIYYLTIHSIIDLFFCLCIISSWYIYIYIDQYFDSGIHAMLMH